MVKVRFLCKINKQGDGKRYNFEKQRRTLITNLLNFYVVIILITEQFFGLFWPNISYTVGKDRAVDKTVSEC